MSKLSKIDRILNIFMLVVITAVMLYSAVGSRVFQRDNWGQDYALEVYGGSWYRIFPSGEKQEIELPGEVKVVDEKEITVATILPEDITRDTYLCFRTGKQDIDFVIDGDVRLAYSNKNNRYTGTHSPVARVFVEIRPEDSGKELQMTLTTDSSYGGILYEVLQGSQIAYWVSSWHSNGMEFTTALFMLILSVIIIVIVLWIKLTVKDLETDLLYLAFGMMTVYTWVMCNSDFRQLLFPNLSIVSDLAFLMILLIPAPFLVYLNAVQKKRHSKLLGSLRTIVLCDFFVCAILHALQIVDFDQSFKYMAAVDAISVMLAVGTMLLDLINGKLKEYRIIAFGFLSIVVCGLVQILLYITHVLKFGGIVMSIGMSVLLICEVYRTIRMLEKSQKDKIEAIQAKEARSKFLANMSHELRTPINSVLGMNTMILRESNDAGIRAYARDIQSAGRSLLSIINDILDFSKIESGKMEIVPIEYDFASMLNDISNMIQPKVDEKGLRFVMDVDRNLPSRYLGDDLRIKQVLINLLSNAVKYTPEGSVHLTVTGTCEGDEAKLLFSVRDTGIGIKEEDLARLTEEFVRIEESRNRNIEGTGLGINIVTNFLHMMGSKLEVESIYGVGSNFFFTLTQPIVKKDVIGDFNDRINRVVEYNDYQTSFCIPDCRLLVVDDNAMNRNVFVNLLKEMLCPIDEAESGMQCLELVKEEKYDIIFMDHMMPDMDGVETFRCMKAMGDYLNADTPVVILTANAINGAKEEYLAEGFDGYLSKPINVDILEGLIGELIPDVKKKSAEKKEADPKTPDVSIDLPFIDGVDWGNALQKLKSEKMLQDSIDVFSSIAGGDLTALKKMYDALTEKQNEENFDAFRIKVHSMKSNAGTIGANHVAGLAKYLEYAARDMDMQTIKNVMPLFEKEWKKLKESIEAMFGKESALWDDEKTTIASAELFELLDNLIVAVREIDFDRIDGIMEELSEHTYPEEQKELLEELKSAVINLDKDQCEAIINQIKEG